MRGRHRLSFHHTQLGMKRAFFSLPVRYLLHVFMEAGCLEWCVVIGLILRDASVIKQVIGFLDSPEVPQETVQSVRSGLLAVDTWASTDWWVIRSGRSTYCVPSEHMCCHTDPFVSPSFSAWDINRFST